VAATTAGKESEKTETETNTPDKAESVCDSEAENVPSGTIAVPVKDFQDRTEGKEKQAGEEVKSNTKTQKEEDEEDEDERNKKKTKEKEVETRRENEEEEKPSEPDSNKSEITRVPEAKSSSPEPDHCQGNITEPMEICSGVDTMGRQQKENDEKVSLMLYFLTWLYFIPTVCLGALLKITFFSTESCKILVN
jgi:hypothetical protein